MKTKNKNATNYQINYEIGMPKYVTSMFSPSDLFFENGFNLTATFAAKDCIVVWNIMSRFDIC